MTQQISLLEIADRAAIRQLIDAYAHCADRRDATGQMALFTQDTVFEVFMDSKVAEPTFVIRGRDGLAPVFADLNQYHATTHFNGQSTLELAEEFLTRSVAQKCRYTPVGIAQGWSPASYASAAEELQKLGYRVILDNLLEEHGVLRHNSAALAQLLFEEFLSTRPHPKPRR